MNRLKGVKRFILVATSAFIVMGLVAEGAVADQYSDEDRLANLVNQARSSHGMGGLALDGDLTNLARAHSASMAGAGTIFHNGALPAHVGGWVALGENVGMGGDADSVHGALMNSASHKANILGDYDRMGIGVVISGSTLFVTQVFKKSVGVAAASSAGPAKKKCRKVRGRIRCTKVSARKSRRARRRRR